jgi:hypothetical protein
MNCAIEVRFPVGALGALLSNSRMHQGPTRHITLRIAVADSPAGKYGRGLKLAVILNFNSLKQIGYSVYHLLQCSRTLYLLTVCLVSVILKINKDYFAKQHKSVTQRFLQ